MAFTPAPRTDEAVLATRDDAGPERDPCDALVCDGCARLGAAEPTGLALRRDDGDAGGLADGRADALSREACR